jgi:hypothetical protein
MLTLPTSAVNNRLLMTLSTLGMGVEVKRKRRQFIHLIRTSSAMAWTFTANVHAQPKYRIGTFITEIINSRSDCGIFVTSVA